MNKRLKDEFYNSRIYNELGNTGRQVAREVVTTVENVVDTVDREIKREFSSQGNNWGDPNPYSSKEKFSSTPPPPPPPVQRYSKPKQVDPKKQNKKEKKEKVEYHLPALRGIIIAAGFLIPLTYLPFEGVLLPLLSAGIGVSTIYASNWAFKVRKKKELPKPVAKSKTGNDELDRIIDEGHAYILKLKAANDAIPDEELSDYIERMENAAFDIFAYVKDNPEKIPQIKKFMNYYLPTTLDLLEKYQKLSTQSVKGENIMNTMTDIERMMYTVALAFEKQLDSLFSSEAMDIGVDISVFESILEQEGLKKEKNKI